MFIHSFASETHYAVAAEYRFNVVRSLPVSMSFFPDLSMALLFSRLRPILPLYHMSLMSLSPKPIVSAIMLPLKVTLIYPHELIPDVIGASSK